MLKNVLAYLNCRTGALRMLFFISLAACAAADVFVPRHEAHFFGDTVPVFWSAFGLAGCAFLAIACKWISKHLIARTEEYYDG